MRRSNLHPPARLLDASQIVERFGPVAPPALGGYLRTHARRYEWTVRYLQPLIEKRRKARSGAPLRVLDVGPSFQSFLLADLVPDGQVDTIGYYDPNFFDEPSAGAPDRLRLPVGSHISFDLNDAQHRDRWPALAGYDLVLMAETIEHLYIGPATSLRFLASGLLPGGYLVVQTPNAVALHKRVWMAIGRAPISPLAEDRPGEAHLHEYTLRELLAGGKRAGLEAIDITTRNYIGGTAAARMYGRLGQVLPSGMRDGMAITFQATNAVNKD